MTEHNHSDHGELKRELAELIGSDPDRYAADIGTERHKALTDEEVTLVCQTLGLGFNRGHPKQAKRDAVMVHLGREHRCGASMWDSSDLPAVIEAVKDTHADARSADVYFHRDGGGSGKRTPFYFCHLEGVDITDDGVPPIERLEADLGAEYERLVGPNEDVRVGEVTWDPDNPEAFTFDRLDPDEVDADPEHPTYDEEVRS